MIRYHTWMENEEIQELTASLPLTLEEEYQMQQTWLKDKDKLTFIILSKEIFDRTHDEIGFLKDFFYSNLEIFNFYRIHDWDVNLFLNDLDDIHCGEVEIMIAESTARKKGLGLETLYTFLRYGKNTKS